MGAVGRLDPGLRSKMKIFAVLLLATAILGMEMEHEKMFKTWTKMKAHEACWGEENTKKYTVQLKRAVAKCTHQDAPELELPIYRSPYRVVNALLNNANQHERYVVNLLENIVDNLNNNQRHNNNQQYYERRHDQNYNQLQQQQPVQPVQAHDVPTGHDEQTPAVHSGIRGEDHQQAGQRCLEEGLRAGTAVQELPGQLQHV